MSKEFGINLNRKDCETMPPKIIFDDKNKTCYHGFIWTDDACCKKCFDSIMEFIMEFSMFGAMYAKTLTTKS